MSGGENKDNFVYQHWSYIGKSNFAELACIALSKEGKRTILWTIDGGHVYENGEHVETLLPQKRCGRSATLMIWDEGEDCEH